MWCYSWVDVICIWGDVLVLICSNVFLSSLDDMDVPFELLAYNVWAAEDDKTGFLSVEVDIFDWLHLKERPISLPMVPMRTKKRKYEKWG